MREIFIVTVLSVVLIACTVNGSVQNGRHIIIKNTKIYYAEYGQGIPLILLSGGGINRSIEDFAPIIPELAKKFRVIAPDSPGQGYSEQPDSLTYDVLVDYMSTFIDSMNIDSGYIMGWSDGGIAALILAAKRSDKIKRVIAVGANNGLTGAVPSFIPIDSIKPLSFIEWEKNNQDAISSYNKKMPRDWKKLMNQFNHMWYQKDPYFSESIYEEIHIPVMIVLGDRDDINLVHGANMYQKIEGSQFCVLPNTSHEVFSESPDLMNQVAIKFFNN